MHEGDSRPTARSEALAKLPPPEQPLSEFDELVVEAIDGLPADLREVVEGIPILVSHLGHLHHAYGHYIGDTVVRDDYRDHIVIYRETHPCLRLGEEFLAGRPSVA